MAATARKFGYAKSGYWYGGGVRRGLLEGKDGRGGIGETMKRSIDGRSAHLHNIRGPKREECGYCAPMGSESPTYHLSHILQW